MAQSTDSIFLQDSGVFPANLNGINKALVIAPEGSSAISISANESFPTMIIQNTNAAKLITLRNLVFDRVTANAAIAAVAISSGSFVRFENCKLAPSGYGALISITDARVEIDTLSFNRTTSVDCSYYYGCVYATGAGANVTVTRSSLRWLTTGTALGIDNAASLTVTNTLFSNYSSYTGAIKVGTGSLRVSNSQFYDSGGVGIVSLSTSSTAPLDIVVANCDFAWFVATSNYAVQITNPLRTFSFTDCSFRESSARAISATNANSVTLRRVTVREVYGTVLGRAAVEILSSSGTVAVDGCTFNRNGLADTRGGGLFVSSEVYGKEPCESDVSVVVTNSVFSNNNAKNGAGFLVRAITSLAVSGSTFSGNTASLQGGAIRVEGQGSCSPLISIASSTFTSNTLTQTPPPEPRNQIPEIKKRVNIGGGGGLGSLFNRDILIAEVAGGAVSIDGPFDKVQVSGSTFRLNTAPCSSGWADGGALRIKPTAQSGPVSVVDTLFDKNEASSKDIMNKLSVATGGALSIVGSAHTSQILRTTFLNNKAWSVSTLYGNASYGGALFVQGSIDYAADSFVTVRDSVFEQNSAYIGGAVTLQQVFGKLTNATFTSNSGYVISAAVALMRSELVEKFDVDDFSVDTSQFTGNTLTAAALGSTRFTQCSHPGQLPQGPFRMVVSGTTFIGGTPVDLDGVPAPYDSNIGVVGGLPFMLAPPEARAIEEYVFRAIGGSNSEGGGTTLSNPYSSTYSTRSAVAVLSDTQNYYMVTFLTDYNVSLTSCGEILSAATLALLPGNAQCTWITSSQLKIVSSPLPYPMTLNFEPLAPMSGALTLYTGPYPVGLPLNPVLPVIGISAPESVAACEDLLVTSKVNGVGVFPFQRRWTVLSLTGAPNVASYVTANAGSTSLFIPDSLWGVSGTPRTLVLGLTAYSVAVSNQVNITIVRAPEPAPTVFVEGPLRRKHLASIELQINGRVGIPPCLASRNLTVTRSWTLLQGPSTTSLASALANRATKGLTLFMPAKALVPGNDYVFQFTASIPQISGFIFSYQVTVSALFSPLLAYPSGDSGLLNSNATANFALTVVDPDSSTSRTLFLWDIGYGDFGYVPPPLVEPPHGIDILEIIASNTPRVYPYYYSKYASADGLCVGASLGRAFSQSLAARALADRNYSVVAYAARDERSVATSFRIDWSSAPEAAAALPIRFVPQWRGHKPLHYERIAATVTVGGQSVLPANLKTEWAILRADNFVDNDLVSASVTTPLDDETLYIAFRPNTFEAGISYSLQLTVRDRSTGAIAGRNWLQLAMNDAPSGGSVVVSPTTVVQGGSVSISSAGWHDVDDPVRYTYSLVIDDAAGDEIVLTDLVDVASTSVALTYAGDFVLRARIFDVLGTASVVDTPIRVTPAAVSQSQSESLALLQDALNVGDLRRASGIVVFLLRQANSVSNIDSNLRASIAASLLTFTQQVAMTSSNSVFLLRVCDLLAAVPAAVDSNVRAAIVDIVSTVIEFAYANSDFGSSSSRLFSVRSVEGERSLAVFASALSSVLHALQNQTMDSVRTFRLLAAVEKVPVIMTRFALTDEEAVEVSSLYFNALSFVRCGSAAFNITMASGLVHLAPSAANPCLAGTAFDVTDWNGTHPNPPVYNVSGNPVPSNSPIISVAIRPIAPSTVTFTVSMTFINIQAPPGMGDPTGCARWDGSAWISTGCNIRPDGSNIVCECNAAITSITSTSPTTSSTGRVSMTLLFGEYTSRAPPPAAVFTSPTPVDPNAPPTSDDGVAGAPSSSGANFDSNIGGMPVLTIAVIATVGGVLLIAAVIGGTIFYKRQRSNKLAVRSIRSTIRQSTHQESSAIVSPASTEGAALPPALGSFAPPPIAQ